MKLFPIFESLSESVGHIDYRFEHIASYSGQDNYELGMYIDDEIMGMIEYVLFEGKISISVIVVKPKFRRKGFGSRMVQAMKNNHPEYEYEESMKTDLGAKFKHKKIDNIHTIPEGVSQLGHKLPVADVFAHNNLNNGPNGTDWELMRLADIDFERHPIKSVNVSNIVPTQRFLSQDNLDRVNNVGNNTEAYLIERGGLYYIIDGHHRIASEIIKGVSSITAYVYSV